MALAKSSKLEDYWRQNNVDNLFKDMTHMLVQKMPTDPAVALVQFLQKKFPKSFRTSTTTTDASNNGIGIVSKTMANSLQLQSMTSPRSEVNMEITSDDIHLRRRSSDHSQVSGIATLPTAASLFADSLKQDITSIRQQQQPMDLMAQAPPELSLRNLVFANRLGQHVVKMGKNIQSDRDILEEELIKPGDIKSTTTQPMDATSDNMQQHEQPSVQQLIKYKQQLRIQHNLREHKQQIAQLAEQERNKTDKFLHPTAVREPVANQKQDGDMSSQVVPQTSSQKSATKPVVKSKEEEEILADEDVFGVQNRNKRRSQRKTAASRPTTIYGLGRYAGNAEGTMPRDRSRMLMLQSGVCKMCGQAISSGDRQLMIDSQPTSAHPTARSLEPQASTRSIETTGGGIVDDWFESASDVSGPRQITPWTSDTPPPPTGSNTFRRSLFQPINNNNGSTVESRPQPLIIVDDEITSKRPGTPRMAESGTFSRSPEPKVRRSSSSQSVPSSVTKKQQPQQMAKTMAHPSPIRPVPPSTLTAPMSSTTGRRMSGWSVREHSPDDSDENE